MSAGKTYIRRICCAPTIPDDYTEPGVELGAKIEEANVENRDILEIFAASRRMKSDEFCAWLKESSAAFDPSTVVVDTDDGDALARYSEPRPRAFIFTRQLNSIRHLNTLFNRANETLEPGGYVWCHCRTAALKRWLILHCCGPGIGHVVFTFHYLWHRVAPKLGFTRRFYMAVTKGRNRAHNRVAILGRLYRSGFEVIDERFIFGEFCVLARKKKAPIWDDYPTRSPLVRLKRVGKYAKPIMVYKFRTMFAYSEYLQPYIHKYNSLQEGGKFASDYRINFWGKFLRKMWLDEVPMFINLFRGDMKLVGVRPLSQHYFSLYTPEMQALRLRVKPGLLPPFYCEKQSPRTLEEVQESERRYIEAYLDHPCRTDWRYFWGILANIVFHGKRSK